MINLFAVFLVLVATVIGAIGSLLLKVGANKLKLKIKALLTNYHLMLGLGCYGVSTIFYLTSLKMEELTIKCFIEGILAE